MEKKFNNPQQKLDESDKAFIEVKNLIIIFNFYELF